MNLKTAIRSELWLAISNTYEAETYSHAILDAMHYLSDVLREKSGADGDGVSLVGQALGGDTPRLRVNKLETETERDIQKGIEHILRGLYQAIRNPRSHEQLEDAKDTADSIIYFVNYLIGILDQSEEPFTLQKFLTRVFDPDFVETDYYANLLVAEIPLNKRRDTLIEIYRKKLAGDGHKLRYMVKAIADGLSYDQVNDFLLVVSDELKTTNDQNAIRLSLQILPPVLWPRISEAARLRIENKLITSIKEGEANNDRTIKGAFGTWARDFVQHFTLKEQVAQVLIRKLEDKDRDDRLYVANFFLGVLPFVITKDIDRERCIRALHEALKLEDNYIETRLTGFLEICPEQWRKEIVERFKDLTDPENPKYYLSDGSPFLGKQQSRTDDLPFL